MALLLEIKMAGIIWVFQIECKQVTHDHVKKGFGLRVCEFYFPLSEPLADLSAIHKKKLNLSQQHLH